MTPRFIFRDFSPDLSVHAVLVQKREPFPPHYHDFYEVMLVTRGSGSHVLSNSSEKPVELHPGSMCLVRPFDIHTVVPRGEITFYNVAFAAQAFEEFCGVAELEHDLQRWVTAPISPVCSGHELENQCAILSRQFASQQSEKLELIKFWGEAASLLRRAERQRAASIIPDWLARTLNEMQSEENLRGGFDRLCQLGHVSSAHMARSFQTHLGQTPTQWLTGKRLNIAATLLLETSLSINEISLRCGFENLPYFYRVFKAKFGTTPRTFRKNAHQVVGA